MSAHAHTIPTSAFFKLVATEFKLYLREPTTLLFGVGLPLLLLIIFGNIPAFQQPLMSLGGLRVIDVYLPVLIVVAVAMLGLTALPTILTSYREKGILRRLSVTPVPPSWVLATQMAINLAVAMLTAILIIGIGWVAFEVSLPRQIIGFVLIFLFTTVAMLALGLLIAAVAPNGRIANGIGSLLFFPLLFLAGLWLPQAEMPVVLRHISEFSPLGAAVQTLQDTMQGQWPHPQGLVVLAGYAIVFSVTAARLFRWQ